MDFSNLSCFLLQYTEGYKTTWLSAGYQNSLSPCITCVQHSHAAKRLLP